jgi:hypothetical protein
MKSPYYPSILFFIFPVSSYFLFLLFFLFPFSFFLFSFSCFPYYIHRTLLGLIHSAIPNSPLTPHRARGRGHRRCTSRRAEGGEGGEAAGRRVRRGGRPFVPAAAGAPMVGDSKELASRPC